MSQSSLMFVISPAKTLDFESAPLTDHHTQPQMLEDAAALMKILRDKSASDIKALMSVSDNIAELNVERNKEWRPDFTLQNAKQAVFAFKGDVYTGINVETLAEEGVDYLQRHLLILSGLYGVLRPLDLMMPYRLEMGTRLTNAKGKNLYDFWGNKISGAINDTLTVTAGAPPVLVNLASNEYFKAAKKKHLQARVITPAFRDLKNGEYKMISFYAKKARGLMVRFAADQEVSDPEELKAFNYEGYTFNEGLSNEDDWVFTRDKAPK